SAGCSSSTAATCCRASAAVGERRSTRFSPIPDHTQQEDHSHMRAPSSESPLAVAAKGGLAGLVGTVAIGLAMQRLPVLLHDVGLLESGPATPDETARTAEQPTQRLAEKVATGVLEQSIDQATRQQAGRTIHWGYGIGWGVGYGIVQGSLHW